MNKKPKQKLRHTPDQLDGFIIAHLSGDGYRALLQRLLPGECITDFIERACMMLPPTRPETYKETPIPFTIKQEQRFAVLEIMVSNLSEKFTSLSAVVNSTGLE